jgi:hypothetical protein
MSVWPHTGGTGQTLAGEPAVAVLTARNCDRGIEGRTTAIIPAVEMEASRSPIFYNESVMSGGLSYGLVAEHIHSSASRRLS